MPSTLSKQQFPGSSWLSKVLVKHGRANAALLAVLGVLFSAGVVFLIEAEKPWGKEVQKRLAKGQELQLEELVIIGLWWAALANVIILLLLLLSSRWWTPVRQEGLEPSGQRPKAGKAIYLLTVMAMAFCAWHAWPKMDQSLWNDEEYAMRRFAHGEWKEDKKGRWEFEPVSWQETLFLSRNGNNHAFSSMVVRWSLDTWQMLTGAAEYEFSERAVRMPSFITALGSIAVVVWLGVLLGYPAAGVGAAFLLGLSPWFLHYAADGKGYSLLIFFLLLHFAGLIKALETGKLRWWLLFAIAQPLYLLSFAGSLYVAIATNFLAVVHLLFQRRFRTLFTLAAFGFIGAIPVFMWAGPVIPQMLKYLARPDALRLGMDWPWVRDLLSSLYLGFGYANAFPETHLGTSWLDFTTTTPAWLHTGFARIVIPALLLVGIITAASRSYATRLVLLAPLLGAIIAFLHSAAKDNPVVVWYFVFLLPFLALLLGVAISVLCRRKALVVWTGLIAVIAIYGFSVRDASADKLNHSRQPIRETADWIKAKSPDAMTVTWGVSDLQSKSYLPRVNVIESLDELHALEALAASSSQPLYVFYCGESVTAERAPELTAYVKSSGHYQLAAEMKGLEELFSYRIYSWQPKPAELPATQPPATAPSPPQLEVPSAAGS